MPEAIGYCMNGAHVVLDTLSPSLRDSGQHIKGVEPCELEDEADGMRVAGVVDHTRIKLSDGGQAVGEVMLRWKWSKFC